MYKINRLSSFNSLWNIRYYHIITKIWSNDTFVIIDSRYSICLALKDGLVIIGIFRKYNLLHVKFNSFELDEIFVIFKFKNC